MAKDKGFKVFTEAKAKKTQKRFAHYLRGYRKRSGLTQKDFSAQLGYTELHYRKLESESPDNTLVKSFDTLLFFAKLQNMTMVDFASYIDQKPIETRNELFPWEKTLLEAFSCLDVESRMAFVHGLCAKTTKDKSKDLKDTVDLAVKLKELFSPEQLEKVLELVATFKK
jgi:transcriptional regulator with XRE-family HTH domain